jgi:hypothetical protein
MAAVLDALAAGATVLGAERAAGVSRGLANDWRRRDPAFAERMETARASAVPRRSSLRCAFVGLRGGSVPSSNSLVEAFKFWASTNVAEGWVLAFTFRFD